MAHRGRTAIVFIAGLVSLSGTGGFLSPRMVPPSATSGATARYAHRARATGRVRGRALRRGNRALFQGVCSSSPNPWCSTAAGSCYSRQRGLGRALETNLYGATYEGGTCHRQRLLGPLQAEAEDGELRGLGIEGDKTTREPQDTASASGAIVDGGGEALKNIPSSAREDLGSRPRRFWGRIDLKKFFGVGKKMPNIKQLGLYALLSYGFVSNISYVICVSMAWFATSKKTGVSPLAPGQRQVFLVSYAAFFAINNVLRVPRFALSMSLAPAFDRLIAFFMRATGRGKTFATVLCVFFVNILGTLTIMSSGILLASLLSGVPLWSGA